MRFLLLASLAPGLPASILAYRSVGRFPAASVRKGHPEALAELAQLGPDGVGEGDPLALPSRPGLRLGLARHQDALRARRRGDRSGRLEDLGDALGVAVGASEPLGVEDD